MNKLTKISVVKEIMTRHGIHFSKGLGQNFLIDPVALGRIVQAAELTPKDWVLEIGPGLGTLTQALASEAGYVSTVEIDQTLLPVLAETLSDHKNIDVHLGDILKIDILDVSYKHQAMQSKAIANLPYYITTPVIFRLLDSGIAWRKLVFLVQKEVAERMVAKPGSKVYGVPSVILQAQAVVSIFATVSAGCFIPRPKVDSAILVLEPYQKSPYDIADFTVFRKIVRQAFAQRRKTLINALTGTTQFGIDKEGWAEILQVCDISPQIRAEKMTVSDFARLSDAYLQRQQN